MFLYFIISLLAALSCVNSQAPTVSTKLGTVTGVRHSVSYRGTDYSVKRFLGIPYAQAPEGMLRFQKPLPFGNFTNGHFPATEFGNSCPQLDLAGQEPQFLTWTEDCLFLNVYVPDRGPDEPTGHAVMIFLHGGGLLTGSSRSYEADTLAAVGNVIVVTINYRLWLFGFLKLEDTSTPGNVGFWDQHLAFQWVKDNIGSFGGDSHKTTIFGQSSGSYSVSLHSLFPGNIDLFQGVISQSGSPFMPPPVLPQNNEIMATLMARKLGCSVQSTDAILKCLQESSAEQIIKTMNKTYFENPAAANSLFSFSATLDGEFIRRQPSKLLDDHDGRLEEVHFLRSLSLMNGFNGNEALSMFVQRETGRLSRQEMDTVSIPSVYGLVFDPETNVPDSITNLIAHEYTDWSGPDDPAKLLQQYSKLQGAIVIGVSAVLYSRLHSNTTHVNSYLYHFVPHMSGHVLPLPDWASGAAHGDELPALLGYQTAVMGMHASNGSVLQPQTWELDMSERLIKYWTNFAKSRDPNDPGTHTWPKYTVGSEDYQILDRVDKTGHYLNAREVDFWKEVVPGLMSPTTSQTHGANCPVSSVTSCCIMDNALLLVLTLFSMLC